MRNSLLRRSFAGLVVLWIALVVGIAVSAQGWSPPVPPSPPGATIAPAPSHVEWRNYPVGGFFLCSLDSLDSLRCLPLPAGSILMVPVLVEDAPPDSLRNRS